MWRRQAIALLALAGLFDALYLFLYKLGVVGELQCGTGGCETVQASRYAMFLGLPVALYGVVGYGVLLAVSLAATHPAFAARRTPDLLLAALASLGVLFTLYLSGLEYFVIHAFCRWCLGSAAFMTAIWVLTLPAVRRRL
ncbi:MAG TPA: vitamin K epoxide reductase family protein [Gemmatimonadales bacterium]|nr:vitamin K epoxide reductase family protein [Gemmatimonadales bacterium]